MLITAIAIKLTSKGPIIFKQERIGYHGKPFMMYKFRSMKVQNPNEEKSEWTTKDDPRKTRVGNFIRKTSIDELPQFFNVLKGDMSVIGPRPERPYFVEEFKEKIKAIADNKGAKVNISDKTKNIKNGFILVYGEIEENCTIQSLFDEKSDALRDIVNKELFS